MLVVKDAMVLIHLARLTLLNHACAYFENVTLLSKVYAETVAAGREHGNAGAEVIAETVNAGHLGWYGTPLLDKIRLEADLE